MEITRPRKAACSASDAPPDRHARVERGRAAVLTAHGFPLAVALRVGNDVWQAAVPPHHRALVCAGAAPVLIEGAVDARPVAASALSRWMAFRDAALDACPVEASPRHPVLVCTTEAVETKAGLSAFLLELLRRDPDMHERLRQQVAAGEHYQIARYVLGEAASSKVGDLAAAYGLSATHFRVRCGEVFGRSAKDQLRELRAARALLCYQGSKTVLSDLALDAGYASQSHFSDEIKAFVGLSPRHIYKAVHQ